MYLDLPSDMPGKDQETHISFNRYKMCSDPSDVSNMLKYLSAGLSKYILHTFAEKAPPFHPTTEEVVVTG